MTGPITTGFFATFMWSEWHMSVSCNNNIKISNVKRHINAKGWVDIIVFCTKFGNVRYLLLHKEDNGRAIVFHSYSSTDLGLSLDVMYFPWRSFLGRDDWDDAINPPGFVSPTVSGNTRSGGEIWATCPNTPTLHRSRFNKAMSYKQSQQKVDMKGFFLIQLMEGKPNDRIPL